MSKEQDKADWLQIYCSAIKYFEVFNPVEYIDYLFDLFKKRFPDQPELTVSEETVRRQLRDVITDIATFAHNNDEFSYEDKQSFVDEILEIINE